MTDNYGLNDDYEYIELNFDSGDTAVSGATGQSPTDWPSFTLGTPLQNVAAIKVLEVAIPFTYYVLPKDNHTFVMIESGGSGSLSQLVTIADGNYTANQLAAAIGPAMTASSPYAQTYTASYSTTLGRFQINGGNTNDFSIQCINNSYSPSDTIKYHQGLATVLGAYQDITSTNGTPPYKIYLPNVANVTGPNYIFVQSASLGNLVPLYMNTGAVSGQFPSGKGNQIAKVPVNCNPFGVIQWKDPDPQKWFDISGVQTISTMDFYLGLGNQSISTPLDLKGNAWSLKLGVLLNKTGRVQSQSGTSAQDRVTKRIRFS